MADYSGYFFLYVSGFIWASAFRLHNLGLLFSEHSISCGPISKREIGKLGAILAKHIYVKIEIWVHFLHSESSGYLDFLPL